MAPNEKELSAMLADFCQVIFGSDANKKPFGERVPQQMSYNHCRWACGIRPNPNPTSWLRCQAEAEHKQFSTEYEEQLVEWESFLKSLKECINNNKGNNL